MFVIVAFLYSSDVIRIIIQKKSCQKVRWQRSIYCGVNVCETGEGKCFDSYCMEKKYTYEKNSISRKTDTNTQKKTIRTTYPAESKNLTDFCRICFMKGAFSRMFR